MEVPMITFVFSVFILTDTLVIPFIFANSANNEAKDAIRSVKELRKNHTEELEDSLSQVKEKLKKVFQSVHQDGVRFVIN